MSTDLRWKKGKTGFSRLFGGHMRLAEDRRCADILVRIVGRHYDISLRGRKQQCALFEHVKPG